MGGYRKYGTADNEFDYELIDASTGADVCETHEHREIHEGDHYFVRSYADLTINKVLQFSWLMPDTAKLTNWKWMIDVENETLFQVYEGGTIAVALTTAVTPRNSNRNSTNTSGTTMKNEVHANLAAADAKIDISAATLLMDGVAGALREGGIASRDSEIILKRNTLYVMRATATAAGFINFDMQWYEHTPLHS